jgi:hypothetical protein
MNQFISVVQEARMRVANVLEASSGQRLKSVLTVLGEKQSL